MVDPELLALYRVRRALPQRYQSLDLGHARKCLADAHVYLEAKQLGLGVSFSPDYDLTYEDWLGDRPKDHETDKLWSESSPVVATIVSQTGAPYETIYGFLSPEDFYASGYEVDMLRDSIRDFYADQFR